MNGTIRIPSTNTRASTLLLRCHSENHRSMVVLRMVKSISALVTANRPSATLEGRTVMRHPDQSPLNRRPGVIQRIVFIINPPLGLREVFGNHIIYVHSAKQTGVRNLLILEYTCLPPLSRPNATEVHVYPTTMDNWFRHPVRGQVSSRLLHDTPSCLC